MKVGVYSEDGKTRAKVNEHPIVFAISTHHALFFHTELYSNGKLIPQQQLLPTCSFYWNWTDDWHKRERDLGKVSGK